MNANRWLSGRKSWVLSGMASMLACGGTSTAAFGDRTHLALGFGVGAQRAGLWAPPVYETRARTIIDPPVYENRVRQVWHEPVHEQRRIAVTIPAEVIERQVPRFDRFGRVIGFETVREIVRPARTEWRVESVCVREGRYETVVDRVLVRPQSARVVHEQVLVTPGHWTQPGRHLISKDRGRQFHVSFGRR